MSTQLVVLASIAAYFAILLAVAMVTKKKEGGAFFSQRKTPWAVAAIAAVGAPISGVTFVSVPGMVVTKAFSYLQMMLGFVVGYFIIAFVLIPLFYKLKLTSIYGYLKDRFGSSSHKSGAWLFFVSKMLGASVRFFVVCVVLQGLVFGPLGIPFIANVAVTVALICLYTSLGGVNTVIWTDTLKSLCLVSSLVLCIVFVAKGLGYDMASMFASVASDDSSRIFFFDNPSEGTYFFKQFLGGVFMCLATTGLDQDLMQRNLHCSDFKASQKSLITSVFTQFVVISLFLVLGVLLKQYFIAFLSDGSAIASQIGTTDNLFASVVASPGMPAAVLVLFIVGLVSASYSAAGSALTALTTSFSLDILGFDPSDASKSRLIKLIHSLMAVGMGIVIIVFNALNNQDAISAVYTLASYTYGPILGMFAFGILTRLEVRDRLMPVVAIAAPLLSFACKWALARFLGYTVGFELILVNAAITFALMLLFSRERDSSIRNRQTV